MLVAFGFSVQASGSRTSGCVWYVKLGRGLAVCQTANHKLSRAYLVITLVDLCIGVLGLQQIPCDTECFARDVGC